MASWDTMAIQAPVSSPSAPVAAAPVALAPGDRVDARVVGPGADGLVRLATAAGLIDANLPATLPAGSRASFIVQSVGAQLTMALIAAVAPDPAAAETSAAAAPNIVADPSRSAVLQAVRQAALASQDGPAPLLALLAKLAPSNALPAPLRDAAAALSAFGLSADQVADPEALAAAIARSGLFGEARAAAGRPTVADLKSALASVLGAATAWTPGPAGDGSAKPAASPADESVEPQAVPLSGRGTPTTVTGDTAPPQLPSDGKAGSAQGQPGGAKAALAEMTGPASGGSTSTALPGASPSEAVTPVTPTPAAAGRPLSPGAVSVDPLAPADVPSPASDRTGAALPRLGSGVAASSGPGMAPSTTSPSGPVSPDGAVDRSTAGHPPLRPAADGQATPKAADGQSSQKAPDGQAIPKAADGQTLPKALSDVPRPGAALALLAQVLGRDTGDSPAPSGTQAQQAPGRPPPPQADRAPAPSLPVPDKAADLSPDMPAGVLRATVIERTEAVLDRIVLSQLASLPAEATGLPALAGQPGSPNASQSGPAQSWVMDLPLRLPGETTAAQLRVSRDGGRGAEGVDAPKGWTVEFALDTTATGPVHARLRLGGPVLGVTLWAERPTTLAALQGAAPDLRRALDEAAFSVETISVLAGAPRQPRPARPGSLVDARS